MSLGPLSRVLSVEDFEFPDFKSAAYDIFRYYALSELDLFSSRIWENVMVLLALRKHNLLNSMSEILVVGGGVAEPIISYLTKYVNRVTVVDRYLYSYEDQHSVMAKIMVTMPELVFPKDCNSSRIVVQHMDERMLRFADETFDAVIAFGIPDRLEDELAFSCAVSEINRVLRKGGILSLCSKYCVHGPLDADRCDGMWLINSERLANMVKDFSKLEFDDGFVLSPSRDTIVSRRSLEYYATLIQPAFEIKRLPVGYFHDWSSLPYSVHVYKGFLFSSLHLLLRKTRRSDSLIELRGEVISRVNRAVQKSIRSSQNPVSTQVAQECSGISRNSQIISSESLRTDFSEEHVFMILKTIENKLSIVRQSYSDWERLRYKGWYNKWLRRLPFLIGFLMRTSLRIAFLGHSNAKQSVLLKNLIDLIADIHSWLVHIDKNISLVVDRLNNIEVLIQNQSEALQSAQAKMQSQYAELREALQQQAHAAAIANAELREALQQQAHAAAIANAELREALQQQVHAAAIADAELREALQQQARTTTGLKEEVYEQGRHFIAFERLYSYLKEIMHENSARGPILSPEEALLLIQELEGFVPSFDLFKSIDISVEGENAENVVIAISRYLGDRMSAKGEQYRYLNDMWMYIGMSGSADWQSLFNEAVHRLESGGLFIRVNDSQLECASLVSGMRLIGNRDVWLRSGRYCFVSIWEKV